MFNIIFNRDHPQFRKLEDLKSFDSRESSVNSDMDIDSSTDSNISFASSVDSD